MTSLCTIEITITDTNDKIPVFTSLVYEAEVTENMDPTTLIQVNLASVHVVLLKPIDTTAVILI